MTIGDRLSKARRDAGFSQADLARLSGVGVATIKRTELGATTPTRPTVLALAAALGLTPGALLIGCEEAP